ncbi:hypothetical protein SBA3_1460016 [Candidatus Sulfopaludibacter sp. SbA3]|nr:hypothetical protein SBA3_1460016 [Candidatus Sulfopaludibacter sp. SbA3]
MDKIGIGEVIIVNNARMLIALLFSSSLAWCQADRILNYYVVGSASCKGGPCWKMLAHVEVQSALLAVAKEPQTAAELVRLLGNSGTTVADLEALRLVQRQGDRYRISFSLLPAEDVLRSHAVAEPYARSLADAVLSRRHEIESALTAYRVPGVDMKDVAFIVLGCFSLDWDGLTITKAKGYRTDKGATRPDGYYVPLASERTDQPFQSFSFSSSDYQGDYGVVYFSDGGAPDRYLLSQWRDVKRATALGSMLLGLRDGKAPAADAEALLAHQLVRKTGDRYEVSLPVLSRLRQIGREVMVSWLTANYAKLQADLAGMAPMRAGVPYTEVFNQTWHDVFGRANAMLVEAGLFADPYGATHTWHGYTPAVYVRSLTR